MRRHGLLNAPLARALAELGHTDLVVVADCGLPRPPGVPVVDLAVRFGLPGFVDVATAVVDELAVEQVTIATEAATGSPARELVQRLAGAGTPSSTVGHDELKELTRHARVVVRTGEATPYANAVLRCGVPF